MSRPSSPVAAVRQVLGGARAVLDWHDRRPRASLSSPRGWVWMALIAALFYWMSNPLVFIPSFFLSFDDAKLWTKVVVLVTLPWLRLPRVPWPWLLFLGLCYLSQLWSISDPNTDLSNLVYFQVAVMALLVAANCEPLVVCWGLGLGGVVVVVLSEYAFRTEMPGASYTSVSGLEFAGVGTNENILAYTLGISLAASLAAGSKMRGPGRILWVALVAVQAYGLYRAGSGTGYLTALSVCGTFAVVVVWPRLRAASRRTRVMVAAFVVAVPTAALLVVTAVLGKDLTTISGRAPFWRAAVEASLDTAPWLGSGWGAVWEHPWNSAQPNSVVQLIYDKAGYVLPHGHNLFVDVMPELGLVGVATAVAMVGYAILAVRRSGLQEGPDPASGRLALFVLVALMVSGITEPMLTVPLGWWTFALVVSVSAQRDLREAADGRRKRGGRRRLATHDDGAAARRHSDMDADRIRTS